jgi:hypothetical protein
MFHEWRELWRCWLLRSLTEECSLLIYVDSFVVAFRIKKKGVHTFLIFFLNIYYLIILFYLIETNNHIFYVFKLCFFKYILTSFWRESARLYFNFFFTKINATWNGLPYILSDVMVSSKLCDKKIVGWLFFCQKYRKTQSSYTSQIRNITNTFIIPYKKCSRSFYAPMIVLLKIIYLELSLKWKKYIFTLFYIIWKLCISIWFKWYLKIFFTK